MFTSIIDTSSSTISVESALICIAAALALGALIAWIYTKESERYSKGFVVTVALLPVLVETIIFMTSGSLGSAIAVLGAFSLVRFRSAPGTSKEILSIFFAMAVGLACGMGQILFAAMLSLIVIAAFVLLMRSPIGSSRLSERHLKVTIPEDLDYTTVFDEIFARYLSRYSLDRVKTVNLGSMYELNYDIVLKDEMMEKNMIDEIRVRNGNLSVICARKSENALEL